MSNKSPDPFKDLANSLNQITSRLHLNLELPAREIKLPDIFKRRASLLIGPRGIGKTTFLLRESLNENCFYVTLDNPLVSTVSFYEFGDYLFQNGYDVLICDEIHCLSNWSSILKALYDAHPKKRIIATDSSTLILRKGIGDLSRRFVIENMSYLSFREYLHLKFNQAMPAISWEEITSKSIKAFYNRISKVDFNLQKEFKVYLREGTRPFFFEKNFSERIINIVDKVIYQDIPFFIPETKERHLQLMKNIIGFLATSPIPSLNIEGFSRHWGISKSTVYNLIEVMSQSGLIRIVAPQNKGGKIKGHKIFFADPTIYHAYNGNLGNVRECYFAMVLDHIKKPLHCTSDEDLGDFVVDELIFEVGGKRKERKQAHFIVRDNIDIPSTNIIPLWMLGFLEA